jgi:hypothetical protein
LIWLGHDVAWVVENDAFAWDFLGTLWDPAHAIRQGVSPYPPPLDSEVDVGNPAYYPPLLMVLVLPLTVLPWALASGAWVVFLAGSVVVTLVILGVRDLRCYLIALITVPVVSGLIFANATLALLPLAALGWRYRERAFPCGVFFGLGMAAKLVLWPIVFWQFGTRRYRAAAYTVLVGAVGLAVPWSLIGFDGLSSYLELVGVAQEMYAVHGLSTASVFGGMGVEADVAVYAGLVLGLLISSLAVPLGRSGRDEAAFFVVVLAALVASPVVWEHYFALLLIPLAIAWPRLSVAWMLLPLAHFARVLPRPRLRADALEPGGSACCPPDDVPLSSWVVSHAPPATWPALATLLLAGIIVALAVWSVDRRDAHPYAAHESRG